MSEGIITRRASDIRPLLLDRFRNAAAAYSLRPLTLSGQDNPVVKVRRSVDDTEQDFNPAQINDGTLEQFVNAGDVAPADYGTGAAAAYSLRYVSDGYTGDVVRVRRSVDNTEQDFNPTEITDGTLLAFCGAGDGLVTTWYDQSGNGNDATQSTAGDQPKIVDAGVLVTENGKPAIDFDGSDDVLTASYGTLAQPNFVAVALKPNVTDNTLEIIDQNNDTNVDVSLIDSSGTNYRLYAGNAGSSAFVATTNQTLISAEYNGAQSAISINGSRDVINAGTNAIGTNFTIGGSVRLSRYSDALYQELIIYDSDQSSNRELIETNVNHYYSIYSQTNDGFVTTWYDQSGNGNDATQSTAASQPKIVDAGSLVVENGKAALDFVAQDQHLSKTLSYSTNNHSIFQIANINGGSGSKRVLTIISEQAVLRQVSGANAQIYGAGINVGVVSNGWLNDNQYLFSGIFNHVDGDAFAFRNGTSIYSNTTGVGASASPTAYSIGATTTGAEGLIGTIQEIIIYSSDRSSTRQQIESNINNHYGIY